MPAMGGQVALRTDQYYRELVEKWLRESGMAEPPVTVFALAEHLGIPVRRVQLPTWFKGAIVSEDGMPAMMLNAAVGDAVQRATLGHMISHVLLLLEGAADNYPRNVAADHREADMMGDEILMPTFMIREQARKWFNDYRYLARLFGVTEGEMLGKMRALGLIKSQGITWDY